MSTPFQTPRSQPVGQPCRKPLYLTGSEPKEVRARPSSLWIRGQGTTVNLPLSRLDRIVSGRWVCWHSDAICLCLTHGIPITWVAADQQAAGTALPARQRCSPLHDALEIHVQRPDWQTRHDNWLAHRRMEVLLTWHGRMHAAGRRVSESAFRQLKRDYVGRHLLPGRFLDEGHAWCHSLVCSHLLDEGVEATYWGFNGQSLELATDIADLFWAEMNLCCGTLPAQVEAGVEAIALFESWGRRHEVRIRHHLGDLLRHVQGENRS